MEVIGVTHTTPVFMKESLSWLGCELLLPQPVGHLVEYFPGSVFIGEK